MLRLFDGLGVHGLDAGALCASAPSISAFIAGRIRLLRAVAPSILRLTLNSRTVLTPGACPPRATLAAGLAPWRACAHDETHRSPQKSPSSTSLLDAFIARALCARLENYLNKTFFLFFPFFELFTLVQMIRLPQLYTCRAGSNLARNKKKKKLYPVLGSHVSFFFSGGFF